MNEVSWDQPVPTLRAFTADATVAAQLDAAFRAAGYRVCECGATVEPPAAVCHACLTGNRKRGPLYGGSLAGPKPDAAPCARCDDLLAQNDDLCIENSRLARQLAVLRGHAELLAAQVRAGKGA